MLEEGLNGAVESSGLNLHSVTFFHHLRGDDYREHPHLAMWLEQVGSMH